MKGPKPKGPSDPSGPSVFLSHARADQARAMEFYNLLALDGFDPWIDKVSLVAGQHWEVEIARAVRASDCVIVLLSKNSVDHRGYVQKEISLALEAASREPEHSIYVLPVGLDNSPIPDRLSHLHLVTIEEPPDLLGEKYLAIQRALMVRAAQLSDRYDVSDLEGDRRWATGKHNFVRLKKRP